MLAPPTAAERTALLNFQIAKIKADAERTSRRARELDDAEGQGRR